LLVYLLRENPENRPQDPLALEHEMRECLTKIERRQAIGRKLGIPLAAVIPRKSKQPKEPATPLAQVMRGVVAFAVLILAAGAAAEFFFPDKIPFLHRSAEVGVPIGVPDAAKFATTPTQPVQSVAANQQTQTSPAVAQENQSSNAPVANSTMSPTDIWKQIASAGKAAEPPSPALGPNEPPSTTEDSEQSSSVQSNEPNGQSKDRTVASNRTSTPRSARVNRASPDEGNYEREPVRQGRHHAQVVGKTAGGGLVVRLSSGRVVTLPPLNEDGIYRSHPRRRAFVQRPGDFVPPSQPFYPND
jgi:hypothetical protein